MTAPPITLGPFVFVRVGGTHVRLDQIATVGDYSVSTLQGAEIMLGDNESADLILNRMHDRIVEANAIRRPLTHWHDDGAPVDDGPAR